MIHFVDIRGRDQNTAGVKAPADMCSIMQKRGYHPVRFTLPGKQTRSWSNFTVHMKNWMGAYAQVKNGDSLIYQYPAALTHYGVQFMKLFLKWKRIKLVLLIHDLDSIRGINLYVNEEKKQILEKADYLICHNEKMKAWLVDAGIPAERIIPLGIFDYLSDAPFKEPGSDPSVIIAGNLKIQKSSYIDQLLKADRAYSVHLYGPNFEAAGQYHDYVYYGSFPPDELQKHIEGAYGLVWDGDSLEECSGLMGNYLRYNNPHKTSFYVSSGIPVIIWKEAALAEYVEKKELGITIGSLKELSGRLKGISEEQYQRMAHHAREEGMKLREGYYLNRALDKTEVSR